MMHLKLAQVLHNGQTPAQTQTTEVKNKQKSERICN